MEENNFLKIEFDSSSLTAANISEEQFESGIQEKVQLILQKEFPETRLKQYIKKETTGINFACPICHDSAFDPRKKRGHIAFRGRHAGLYTCFNSCGSMSLKKFFKHFGTDLSLTDINYISNNITSNIINKEEAYKWAIDRNYIRDVLGLQDIGRITTPDAYNYLINRCQYQNHERFLYSDKYNQILILNLVDDRVIGMQIRNLAPKQGQAKYLTMTIEKMRQTMLGDKTPVPETILKLSLIFNIFNVDFAHTSFKPIFVTEGPFDAFLLPNCIATSGANKHLGVEFPFWYVYDSDKTGKQHALAALKQGYNVFLWKKLIMDLGLPNREKWDVNDVIIWLKQQNREDKINWGIYFSSNPLDGLNI